MAPFKLNDLGDRIGNICFIGAGYVGGPTSSVIAYKNPDLIINTVDLDEGRINAWKSDRLPITEPALLEIVRSARDGADGRKPNLFFSNDIERAIQSADAIFVAVNTPTSPTGALVTTHLEAAVKRIAQVATSSKIIVVKSTVPPGLSRKLYEILISVAHPGIHFDILCNPEFLAEGTAVQNLLNPDRILIGSAQDARGLKAMKALRTIYRNWVPQERVIAMHNESAELAKLAANVLLAQRLSSINALSIICEETGADIEEVALACGLDTRIGPRMLKASLGFGGSCLEKDVLAMTHLSDTLGLAEISSYWRSVSGINDFRKSRFNDKIVGRLGGDLSGKRIAVLGLAFKKDTADVRESPAIDLLATLVNHGAHVATYDPKARKPDVIEALTRSTDQSVINSSLDFCNSAYTACNGAHALVIATDWDEFSNRETAERAIGTEEHLSRKIEDGVSDGRDTSSDRDEQSNIELTPSTEASLELSYGSAKVNWAKIAAIMEEPKLVFDGRNVVNGHELVALGFQVEAVGKGGSPDTTQRGLT